MLGRWTWSLHQGGSKAVRGEEGREVEFVRWIKSPVSSVWFRCRQICGARFESRDIMVPSQVLSASEFERERA